MNKALKYGFGAIALYLLVAYGSNPARDFTAGAGGLSSVVAAFQGRNQAA